MCAKICLFFNLLLKNSRNFLFFIMDIDPIQVHGSELSQKYIFHDINMVMRSPLFLSDVLYPCLLVLCHIGKVSSSGSVCSSTRPQYRHHHHDHHHPPNGHGPALSTGAGSSAGAGAPAHREGVL